MDKYRAVEWTCVTEAVENQGVCEMPVSRATIRAINASIAELTTEVESKNAIIEAVREATEKRQKTGGLDDLWERGYNSMRDKVCAIISKK